MRPVLARDRQPTLERPDRAPGDVKEREVEACAVLRWRDYVADRGKAARGRGLSASERQASAVLSPLREAHSRRGTSFEPLQRVVPLGTSLRAEMFPTSSRVLRVTKYSVHKSSWSAAPHSPVVPAVRGAEVVIDVALAKLPSVIAPSE